MKLFCLDCKRPIDGMPIYPKMRLEYKLNSYKAHAGTLTFEPGCPNFNSEIKDYCKSHRIVKANRGN